MSENLRRLQVHSLSLDISTSSVKVAVMGYKHSDMDIASVKMLGAITFLGQPAFELSWLPKMIKGAITQLEDRGWIFPAKKVSFCVRQHDLVVLDKGVMPIVPSLSWQCNSAVAEVAELKNICADMIVGKIEERFILPKLVWLLEKMPELRKKIGSVMSLDAYVAFMLTGNKMLSSSEAMSNGLVDQIAGELSKQVIKIAGLNPAWFPEVVPCGTFVGKVKKTPKTHLMWGGIVDVLDGADVYAGKGDNDSSAAGCGLNDRKTIIVSAGSSGTVLRKADPSWLLTGEAACFEYFGDRLLLMMLNQCATWYEDFCQKYVSGIPLDMLDHFAEMAIKEKRCLTLMDKIGEYPEGFQNMPPHDAVASLQGSIVYHLLLLVKKMLAEVASADCEKIERLVLTGGLSQSAFIRRFFKFGLSLIDDDVVFQVGTLPGKFAFETAAFGALITARANGNPKKAFKLMEKVCSVEEYFSPDDDIASLIKVGENIFSKL